MNNYYQDVTIKVAVTALNVIIDSDSGKLFTHHMSSTDLKFLLLAGGVYSLLCYKKPTEHYPYFGILILNSLRIHIVYSNIKHS